MRIKIGQTVHRWPNYNNELCNTVVKAGVGRIDRIVYMRVMVEVLGYIHGGIRRIYETYTKL